MTAADGAARSPGGVVVLHPPLETGPPVRLARGRRARILVPLALVVPLAGLGAVVMMLSGEPLVLALGLTIAAALVLGCVAVGSLVLAPRDGRIELETVRRRLELPPTRVARLAGPVGAGLALLFSALLVLGGLQGVDMGPTRFTSPFVGLVLAAIVLVGVLRNPPGGARAARLVLTPDGVGRRRGTEIELLPWDEVTAPRLSVDPAVQLTIWRRSVTPAAGARASQALADARLVLPLATYRSDPNLVVALVEHYRTHARDRAELGTAEAVERVRQGELRGPRRA